MKITINNDILKKYNITFGEFIVLLGSYYNFDYKNVHEGLEKKKLIEKNLFSDYPPIISDNTKKLIAKILAESSDAVQNCPISDFEDLAERLQYCYPDGIKAGKTYPWRSDIETIAQKLRTLVAKYGFTFTEEEAIEATAEYVQSFTPPYTYMHTLRNFILFNKKDASGHYEMESIFMTIIENNRERDNEDNIG